MSNLRLVSFDLRAEFGFLKKPDINDGIYLTYNMLHKPALLGILGAIVGLQGYQQKGQLPQYYSELEKIKVGITPIGSDRGNYIKEVIKYNNAVGYANSDAGILNVQEQCLIKPAYRCYMLININNENEKKLYENLKAYHAEFLPYMGKNDFSAWWDNFREYEYTLFDYSKEYEISSIFLRNKALARYIETPKGISSTYKHDWFYFERLPIGWDKKLFQYIYDNFVFSNASFSENMREDIVHSLYQLDDHKIIQLF